MKLFRLYDQGTPNSQNSKAGVELMLVEAKVRIFQSKILTCQVMQISFCLTLAHIKTADQWEKMRIMPKVIIFMEAPVDLSADQLVQ